MCRDAIHSKNTFIGIFDQYAALEYYICVCKNLNYGIMCEQ